MTTSGLASPPRAAPKRAHGPAPTPPRPPRRPERSPPTFERVFGWSLVLSFLLHLLFLLISPSFRADVPAGSTAAAPATAPEPFGLQMIVPIPSEDAPESPAIAEAEDDEPPLTRPSETPARVPTPATGGGQAPPAETPPSSGGDAGITDALRPGFRDSRLYIEPDRFPELRRTQHERYMEHLQARIDAVNDSLGLAAARNSRTSDWSVTDGSGRRWGLSPDGLHLGDITIGRALLPLPAATGDNQSLEAEREALRRREEIQNQEARREREETSAERIEQIRDDTDSRRGQSGSE